MLDIVLRYWTFCNWHTTSALLLLNNELDLWVFLKFVVFCIITAEKPSVG